MIINNNEFEANHHALKHKCSTQPSDAFLSFADFVVHEKDCTNRFESSKIFVEHALLVPRILFQTQA